MLNGLILHILSLDTMCTIEEYIHGFINLCFIVIILCLLNETYGMLPTLNKKTLATLYGEIVDTEIAVKLEMWDVLKVHDVQT